VQNSAYADALERGTAAASTLDDPLDAIMAILTPVVECNRTQVDNGRTYLREIVFGDHDEPHHRDAVGYSLATAEAVAAVLTRLASVTPDDAATRAQVASAIMFTTLAATPNAASSVESLVAQIRAQVEVILPPVSKR
jgi:TetR/AcrR family transcriptional regulator